MVAISSSALCASFGSAGRQDEGCRQQQRERPRLRKKRLQEDPLFRVVFGLSLACSDVTGAKKSSKPEHLKDGIRQLPSEGLRTDAIRAKSLATCLWPTSSRAVQGTLRPRRNTRCSSHGPPGARACRPPSRLRRGAPPRASHHHCTPERRRAGAGIRRPRGGAIVLPRGGAV
jgi:hypothetical protein